MSTTCTALLVTHSSRHISFLGTSTVFHAGLIGCGKRPAPHCPRLDKEAIELNQFTLVSIIFKLCHQFQPRRDHFSGQMMPAAAAAAAGDKAASCTRTERRLSAAEAREKSKEACKQLALLLVEVVSPDVMYNGLPWPDEDFIVKGTFGNSLLIITFH